MMLEDSDRFIPQRCCMQHDIVNLRTYEVPVQCSLLKQDLREFLVQDYRKLLETALNVQSMHTRLMKYTKHSLRRSLAMSEEYHWPVRSRKRPLIKQPHHLLDLPNFKANFFLNLLDWGPSNYLAAALYRSVYLYAVGDSPIELTEVKYGFCSSVKWNCTGTRLLVGTSESLIQVWNTSSRRVELENMCPCFKQSVCSINTTVWHPSNKLYASGCSNGRLAVSWLDNHMVVQLAHDGQVATLKSSSDGCYLASSGEDGAVRVWIWESLANVLEITDYDYPIRAMAWHPWKSSYLVIGGSNEGTLTLWNVNKCSKQFYQLDSVASVTCVEFSPITGELVASIWVPDSATDMNPLGHSVILVMKSLDKVVDRLEVPAGHIHSLLWSPDGKELATVGSDETLRIWYFLGPNSANSKDVSRYLKAVLPPNYLVPPCKTVLKSDNTLASSFGCLIR